MRRSTRAAHAAWRLAASLCAVASCGHAPRGRSDSAGATSQPASAMHHPDATDTIPWPEAPCTAVAARRVPHTLTQLESLAGRWVLTVVVDSVARQGREAARSARGSLELWRPDSVHSHFDPRVPGGVGPNVRLPIVGATDVRWDLLAPDALRHSPASRDPDEPGVQIWENGMVVIGNSFGRKGRIGFDMGVYLSLDTLGASYFAGRWAHGGRLEPLPRGHYCAFRIDRGG